MTLPKNITDALDAFQAAARNAGGKMETSGYPAELHACEAREESARAHLEKVILETLHGTAHKQPTPKPSHEACMVSMGETWCVLDIGHQGPHKDTRGRFQNRAGISGECGASMFGGGTCGRSLGHTGPCRRMP